MHNQVLLQYDYLPVNIGPVHTSAIVPPLLAVAYVLLGCVLPGILESFVGRGGVTSLAASLSPRARAGLAVTTTVAIIKASELLTLSPLPSGPSVLLLAAACVLQWAALDGAWSSFILAALAALGGPVCELPLMGAGAWHYLDPDYYPLAPWGLGPASFAGLSSITGPCYFAVCTDAIALGRWFRGRREKITETDPTQS